MNISLRQAKAAVAEIVAIWGADFVYNPDSNSACHYTPQPGSMHESKKVTGCLVGEPCVRLGMDVSTWMGTFSQVWEAKQLPFTNKAGLWLNRVQEAQDGGHNWGEAVAKADELLETLRKAEKA